MRLTDRIHLIGSGRFGLAISDDYDCNVYLIDAGDELVLIDSGAGIRPVATLVEEAGFDPALVSTVLVTHKHADHSGGAGDLQRSHGCRIAGSSQTAAAVQDAERMNAGLERARRAKSYPADYRFQGADAIDVLQDGEVLRIGDVAITVVDTAGHCEGHLAYVLDEGGRTSAFTGDALLPGGEIVVQPSADLSLPASIESIERLAALGFDALMPGHGAPALRDGYRHARLALIEAARNGVPAAFRTPPFHEAS